MVIVLAMGPFRPTILIVKKGTIVEDALIQSEQIEEKIADLECKLESVEILERKLDGQEQYG